MNIAPYFLCFLSSAKSVVREWYAAALRDYWFYVSFFCVRGSIPDGCMFSPDSLIRSIRFNSHFDERYVSARGTRNPVHEGEFHSDVKLNV